MLLFFCVTFSFLTHLKFQLHSINHFHFLSKGWLNVCSWQLYEKNSPQVCMPLSLPLTHFLFLPLSLPLSHPLWILVSYFLLLTLKGLRFSEVDDARIRGKWGLGVRRTCVPILPARIASKLSNLTSLMEFTLRGNRVVLWESNSKKCVKRISTCRTLHVLVSFLHNDQK